MHSMLRRNFMPMALCAAAMAAVPASAQIDSRLWSQQQIVGQNLDTWTYVNLALSAGTGRNYATWTDPNGNAGMKYFTLDLGAQGSGTPGVCYEVGTSQVSGTASSTDTRIFYQSGASSWASASDDRDLAAGIRTSRVRVWMPFYNYSQLRVQGFSGSYNSIDFRVTVVRLKDKTTAAQCEDPGKPFLNYPTSAGWPTPSNVN